MLTTALDWLPHVQSVSCAFEDGPPIEGYSLLHGQQFGFVAGWGGQGGLKISTATCGKGKFTGRLGVGPG